MALNNRRRAQRHLALGLADPQIVVPETAYAEAQQINRQSLIGRVLGPRRRDLYPLIDTLPFEWLVDRSRLRGRIIGGGKFQFLFETEHDLEMVLCSGPYTYNGRLVVLQRWEDEPGPDFLNSIPMWVKIRGIPIRYLSEGTVREIVSYMGEVMEIELDDSTFDVRARVNVSVGTRLCFKKVVRFESGEVKLVRLRYENIACNKARFKFCRNCGDLNHLSKSCTHVWVDVPDPNERPLSPPPSDGSAENNGERGTSSGTLEEQLDPADGVQGLPNGDVEHQQQQGLDSVEEGDGKEVQSEMAGTSSGGSKRKFEAVEEADDIVEKRIRGSSGEAEGLGVNLKPFQEE